MSPASKEFPEFAQFEKAANGRFIGVLGYSLVVPGYETFLEKHTYNEAFVVPGTSDNWQTSEEVEWNSRARAFAKRYNEWLRKQKGEG